MNKYDIYWFDVIFEEDLLSNNPQSKRRPILILDNDFIAPFAPITSHVPRTDKDYKIINWKEAGLSGPSTIRFGYKRLLNRSKLGNDYIGHLSQEDINRMKELHLIESLNEGFVGVKGPVQTKYDDKFNLSNVQERTAADIIGACWAIDPYADMYEFTEYTPDMEEFFEEEEPSLAELVKYYVMQGKEKEFLKNIFDIDGQIEEVQSWDDPNEENTIEFLKSVRDKYLGGEEDTVSHESLDEAKNDTLNPAIWDENNELKPEVKEKLEFIAQKFIDGLEEEGIYLDVEDVVIVGSNANYVYTDKSDIDLHIIFNSSNVEFKD